MLRERVERVERWAPWLLGVVAFVACVASFPKWPTEWDSVQLTLGVDRFDIREGSPHPPGYWLYVAAARGLRAITPFDAKTCLQWLAAAAAAATVGLAFVLGRELRGRWLAWATAGFLLTSPFVLFYGSIVASYAFDALLSVVLLLLAVRARPGSRHGIRAAAALGLGAGFRPSSLLILSPIVAWAAVRSVRSVRQLGLAAAAGAAGLLAWIVPMVLEQPGGAREYWSFSRNFYKPAFETGSLLYGATWPQARFNMSTATAYTLAAIAVLVPVAAAGLVLAAAARRRGRAHRANLVLVTAAAVVPYAFVMLVFFGKAGYVLSYLPAAAILLLWPAATLEGKARAALTVLVAIACLVNVQRFASAQGILPTRVINNSHVWFTQTKYGAPYPATRTFARQIDHENDEFLPIRQAFDPAQDVLVYFGSNGGERFRHGCYAFPNFRVHLVDPADKFLCKRHRMLTEADADIELPSPNSRVVFTLNYMDDEVRSLVATGRLVEQLLWTGRTVWVGGPGVTLYGVTAVVTPDHPLKIHLN
jgi:hypothetical protein